VYLRTYSPYLDSSFLYSKSQNTIRVNLLGNHSTSCYYIIDFLFTYIPSLLASLPWYFPQGFITRIEYRRYFRLKIALEKTQIFSLLERIFLGIY